MSDFFTTVQTQPPAISLPVYLFLLAGLLFLGYLSVRYYNHPTYVAFFKWVQILQLVFLYSWYMAKGIPFSNSLPLYHCRLAMLALLFLPDNTRLKQYFALMGLSGAVFAIGYPVMDAYDFPHITAVSFIIGHYALLVNSLVYLLGQYQMHLLQKRQIISYTLVLNFFLVLVNQITGGNYGILRHPPFITDDYLSLNYLVVSVVLIAMLLLLNHLFVIKYQKEV